MSTSEVYTIWILNRFRKAILWGFTRSFWVTGMESNKNHLPTKVNRCNSLDKNLNDVYFFANTIAKRSFWLFKDYHLLIKFLVCHFQLFNLHVFFSNTFCESIYQLLQFHSLVLQFSFATLVLWPQVRIFLNQLFDLNLQWFNQFLFGFIIDSGRFRNDIDFFF